VLHGECDNGEKAVTDKVGEQLSARGSLQILRNRSALVKELHSIILPLGVGISGIKDGKEFSEERSVRLNVIDDFHLVEEDQGIQD
jgi:hypothetical protein